jgi:hypothetical protein
MKLFLEFLLKTFCHIRVTISRGRFHQHFRPNFSLEQNEKPFLANGVWRNCERRLAKKQTILANFDLLLAFKLNGKFFAKPRAPATFRLAKTV